MPGAPTPILYTNQITQIPNLSLSFVTSNATELTVTLDVSFDYRMKGTDHYEFTFTNSNTGISTTKSYQQSGNVYTIGEFDPGTNYFVYVTPVINGLFTASSATTSFLSSPATAPGLIQGAVLTGSGSFAVIRFAGVYPSSPFPNQIAVNDNFGNAQVLVDVTSALKRALPSYRLKAGARPDGPGGAHDGTFGKDWAYVAGSGDLDECNGRMGKTPEFPAGTYYYVLTDDYPFVPRLWRGTPDSSFSRRGPPPRGGPDGGKGKQQKRAP